jgi:hypothetical protein
LGATKAAVAIPSLPLGGVVGAGTHAALMRAPTPAPSSAAPSEAAPPPVVPHPVVSASSEGDAPVAPSAPSAPSATAPTATARRPEDAPPASVRPVSSGANSAASRDEALRAEQALVDVARTAAGRGHGRAALEALRRHRDEFPRGRLVEEREGLLVRALLLEGRRDEARAQAARFRRSFPRSMLPPSLDAALEP